MIPLRREPHAQIVAEPRGFDRERCLLHLMRAEQGGPPRQRGPLWQCCKEPLRRAGLRPTRQRMLLAWLLFSKGNRHITAEMLYEEASRVNVPVSLATVYNALHQFTEAGLLRHIGVDQSKAYFDTNPSEHHHFFVEGDGVVSDIPPADVAIDRLPEAPAGFEIVRVDVVVRLRRKPT